ncbi:MAG TPA: methyltransferase domain-containing protein [Dehalococcoidia bacterium]|nr:methyltransferase domain-containing protein [Dehalococcoidia bacterium]
MVQTDQWSPAQYNKFRTERMQPFFDLVALIRPRDGMQAIDLGCGTGELTALLAERLPAATVLGVDSSAAMLEQAAPRAGARLSFARQAAATLADFSAYDLVFSHAALQWVPNNEGLMRRILGSLRPGAQIAVQLPNNEAHPSHVEAQALAAEPPFREQLGGFVRRSEALPLERYAELLHEHGFREQACFEKIYGHELPSSSDVVEWVKGTSLGSYLSRLNAADAAAFQAAYRARLLSRIGEQAPYFYPFRRMLFWGIKA